MLRVVLPAIPIVALTIALPLANRAEPRIFGLPFLFVWIVGWTLTVPGLLWSVGRLERRW